LAKALSLSVLSALLVLTVGGIGGAVRAEDTCLPAPTGKTPPGSHWHYRTDPVKQTKCWYLRSQGDAAQPAATGDGADAAGTAPAPAAPTPKPAKPHQASKPAGAKPSAAAGQPLAPSAQMPPAQAASPMQGGAPANAAPATQGAAPWPDPQPQGGTGSVAWPAPPTLAPAATTNAAPGAGGTNAAADSATAGQDTGSINAGGAGESPAPEASPPPPPTQTSDVSGSTILVLAAAMAIAGVLMRWLLGKLFARRRKIAAERREPVWVTDEYVMPDALTRGDRRPPGRVDPDQLDDEVKHALRKLLRTLERSAA
jgi:hypothetical protein